MKHWDVNDLILEIWSNGLFRSWVLSIPVLYLVLARIQVFNKSTGRSWLKRCAIIYFPSPNNSWVASLFISKCNFLKMPLNAFLHIRYFCPCLYFTLTAQQTSPLSESFCPVKFRLRSERPSTNPSVCTAVLNCSLRMCLRQRKPIYGKPLSWWLLTVTVTVTKRETQFTGPVTISQLCISMFFFTLYLTSSDL